GALRRLAVCPNEDPRDEPSPIGLAFEWVGRIFAVVVEMVGPGLLGQYLDWRMGTRFLVLVGFGGGLTLAIWHLIAMTKGRGGSERPRHRGPRDSL
ncbi:MAG TPA: hypothetical protein VHV08_13050, partial [Pirellulales bacterium]|nr:hypothetical protein [Pirellulales bacterium]